MIFPTSLTIRGGLIVVVAVALTFFCSHSYEQVEALSNHQGPTFSVSEQALFGGYNYGEASLFGGPSSTSPGATTTTTTTTGTYTSGLWVGRKNSAVASQQNHPTYYTKTEDSHVPFQGETVEAMTFMPQTMRGVKNNRLKP
jgi:amino acid transporter